MNGQVLHQKFLGAKWLRFTVKSKKALTIHVEALQEAWEYGKI
jgi:hypothetical protein